MNHGPWSVKEVRFPEKHKEFIMYKINPLWMAFKSFNTTNDPILKHTKKNQEAMGRETIKASFTIIEGEEVKNGETLKAITKRI